MKKQAAHPLVFDLILVISGTKEKTLQKAKKREDKESLDIFSKDFIQDIMSVLENFGVYL